MELPRIFKPAKQASLLSDHKQHKMGAAVFYGKGLIACGFNHHKTDPFIVGFDKAFSIHSELHALKKAKAIKFDLTNSTIVVYREKKDGSLGMAKPCEMCEAAIKLYGIKFVFYTTETGWERIKYG